MRQFILSTVFLTSTCLTATAVQIDGYCYLENQTNHEGTKVLFQADSPSAVTDSVYTDSDGYYLIDLNEGFYDVFYSRLLYYSSELLDVNCFSPATLPEVTLEHIPQYTPISGSLSGTLIPGEYLVEDDIYIEEGSSLIIEPGAKLYFWTLTNFEIRGCLSAAGTESDSIFFHEFITGAGWDGIRFEAESADSSVMEYCAIQFASGDGLTVFECSPTISHCRLNNNIWNGVTLRNSASTIDSCEINNNSSEGIQVFGNSTVSITNCLISGNSSHGLMTRDGPAVTVEGCEISTNSMSGVYCENSTSEIIDNTIIDNGESGIYYEGGAILIVDNLIRENSDSGIRLRAGESQTIDSNVIDSNTADHGGGINCMNCDPVITNNEISANYTNSEESKGGGIYLDNCDDGTVLTGNEITGNYISLLDNGTFYLYGGGAYCTNCTIIISENTFSGNYITGDGNQASCYLYGGGLSIENSNVEVTSNTFQQNSLYGGNTAWYYHNYGGGVYINGGIILVEGNSFIENSVIGGTNFMVSNYLSGGGLYGIICMVEVIENDFIGNIADEGNGGGVMCKYTYSGTVIDSCLFSENSASCGAGINCEDCDLDITRNIVVNNDGEGIRCRLSDSNILNCTVNGNSLNGIHLEQTAATVENTIVTNNQALGGIRFIDSPNSLVKYSDFHNNAGGNFYGSPPSIYLGIIVTTNINDDSCDAFYNVFGDPLFADPASGDYQITWENFPVMDETRSPCIDAGSPLSSLDPDGTLNDAGVFYFDQIIPVVTGLTITIDGEDVILDWEEVPQAAFYNIYRADTPYFETTGMTPVATVTGLSHMDENAAAEGMYFYIVTWE